MHFGTMKVSVPASAARTPPETGASSIMGFSTYPEIKGHQWLCIEEEKERLK